MGRREVKVQANSGPQKIFRRILTVLQRRSLVPDLRVQYAGPLANEDDSF